MKIRPSEQQRAIYEAWTKSDKNLLIEAGAGSGKTTVLLGVVERSDKKTLFLAFNKKIQVEISDKLEKRGLKQGKAMTVHSLGLSSIRSNYKEVTISSGKNFTLIKKLEERNKKYYKTLYWKEKVAINYTLMDMNNISRLFLTNDIVEITKQALMMGKSLSITMRIKTLWEELIEIREKGYDGKSVLIDFIDMIYLPVLKEFNIPLKPTYLCVDEVQDLSLLQHKLIDILIGQGDVKKWCFVGDRKQSIYLFAGAHSNSFDIIGSKENVSILPLNTCYRCPQLVIDEANEVFDVMEYGKEEKGTVGVVEDILDIKDSAMIICRNTSPIIELFFGLLGINKTAYILGEDLLASIKRFLSPFNYSMISSVKTDLTANLEKLSKAKSDAGRIKYYIFKENYSNFILLSKHVGVGNMLIKDLLVKVEKLFIEKENAIMLCTIHKAKGLEADIVYILNEHLIPSKFATSEEQLLQEQNLKYVARTRAKKELYYLNL